jgi:hypothetical protein
LRRDACPIDRLRVLGRPELQLCADPEHVEECVAVRHRPVRAARDKESVVGARDVRRAGESYPGCGVRLADFARAGNGGAGLVDTIVGKREGAPTPAGEPDLLRVKAPRSAEHAVAVAGLADQHEARRPVGLAGVSIVHARLAVDGPLHLVLVSNARSDVTPTTVMSRNHNCCLRLELVAGR